MKLFSTFGHLPGTWINLFLIVVSGIIEGVGISMFIPLLQMMDGKTVAELPRPFSVPLSFLAQYGVAPGTITILVLIAILSLSSLGLVYIQRKLLIQAKSRYVAHLRATLFGSILSATWVYSSKHSHGDILNYITTECARAGQALGFELMAAATLLQITVYLVFSMAISWQLTIIVGIFGALIFLSVRPFTRRAKMLGKCASTRNREFSFFSLEYLRSLKILKSTASEDIARDEISKRVENLYEIAVLSEINATKVFFVVQALPILLLTVLIGVSHEVFQISVSLILVFLLFMMRAAPRIAQLQQQFQSYYLNSPGVSVVSGMIDESAAAFEPVNRKGKCFEKIEKAIVLENLSFTYASGSRRAISDISMTIGRNKLVAIVGRSGAGKSTLMDILTGLQIPDKGRIVIDDVALEDFDLFSWRRRIRIVAQDITTFNGSLRENLVFFDPEASDEDISRALSIAHLDEVVADLPDGLNTILGESGVRFSGGQKQRIAIARALVGQPELLLLDEATSALDNQSESYIQEALSKIAHTMTIVVIAHRLSTIHRADIIYVMDEGKLAEQGSYDELIKSNGIFADLQALEFD